jgi:hypothetical protein
MDYPALVRRAPGEEIFKRLMCDLGDLLGVFDAQQNWRIHALVFWSAIAPYRLVPPADKFPLVLDLNGLARVDRFEDWQKSGPVVQFAERQMRPLVRISKEST